MYSVGQFSHCRSVVNYCVNMAKRYSSDMTDFKKLAQDARNVVFLTGAGISAESGVPTFRSEGGLWRKYNVQELASLSAFNKDPSLVWEFYHYRRELVRNKLPNKAHFAISQFEERMQEKGGRIVVITQNVDELHKRAGTKTIIELHGSLFETRCTKCNKIEANVDSPICEALADFGKPDVNKSANIPLDKLPRCKSCKGLLRPNVVWFGENLSSYNLRLAQDYLEKCDLCVVVGTSALVFPAAAFAPAVAYRGIPVAEFNIEETDTTKTVGFHFHGPASLMLTEALDYKE